MDFGRKSRDELEHDLRAAQQTVVLLKRAQDVNGLGAISGMPIWVKVIAVLGFPIFVAVVLLGMFTGIVPSPVSATAQALQQHVKDETGRTRIIRVMCRHQAAALRQPAEECDPKE